MLISMSNLSLIMKPVENDWVHYESDYHQGKRKYDDDSLSEAPIL